MRIKIRCLLLLVAAYLIMMPNSVNAITIDLLQNGNFEANGGSLQGWSTYGDVTIQSDASGDHFARLGGVVTDGGALLSQYFTIGDNYLEQTLAFTYDFQFVDQNSLKFDVFAVRIYNGVGGVTEEALLLRSYDTALWTSTSGLYTELLNPQLASGTYNLKFSLTEGSYMMSSYLDVDDVSLTVAVPEPTYLFLLGAGLIGFAIIRRKTCNML